jgi:ABC-type nitrate/sulfonate/bicarbonate transport system substrate-binding protein
MRSVARLALWPLAVFILVSASASGGLCAELVRVRMGLAARSTTSMPFFVAKERGFFAEEGLDVELIVMQAIQTIQATMGKSTQFASATGSAVSAAVSGADMKTILAVTDRPSFDLIVQTLPACHSCAEKKSAPAASAHWQRFSRGEFCSSTMFAPRKLRFSPPAPVI